MRKKLKQIRQGDILLYPVDDFPTGLKKKDKILALGEATGHSHRFDETDENVMVFTDERGRQFVEVLDGNSVLKHEEHGHVNVHKGKYELRTQREHDITTRENRRVAD